MAGSQWNHLFRRLVEQSNTAGDGHGTKQLGLFEQDIEDVLQAQAGRNRVVDIGNTLDTLELPLRVLVKPGVVYGDGGLPSKNHQQLDLLLGERMFFLRVNSQDAERFVFGDQWDSCVGNQAMLAIEVRMTCARISLQVGYDQRRSY